MAKTALALVLGAICFLVVGSASADWSPGDGYKMVVPMYPNEWGWNVRSTTSGLADDWRCKAGGPVTDIHFWGSWKDGKKGNILGFTVTIWSDVPVNPQDPTSFSHPGTILWGPHYITEFQEVHVNPDPQAWEGWYDLQNMEILQNNHTDFYQYNLVNLPTPYFVQTAGEIYWLQIDANVQNAADPTYWGWKSSYMEFMDDAVYPDPTGLGWMEIHEPSQARMNGFHAEIDPEGVFDQAKSSGEFAYGDGWYEYNDDPSGNWWNVWFYDHPFRPERWKEVWANGFVNVQNPLAGPGWIEIAINWSTPQWSRVGNPPGEPRRPPLPEDLGDIIPGSFLQRHIILQRTTVPIGGIPLESLGWSIDDWGNPEWVSIDIRGSNIIIDGMIQHLCVGPGSEPASMNLSFIVTGPPTGACCDGAGQCFVTTKAICEATAGNTYMGDNVPCLGDGNGNGQDDRCEAGPPRGACCVPSDGSCYMADAATCTANGDNYVGDGTACLGDLNGNGMDDACEPPPGACCLPDGTCVMTDAATCMSAMYNGDYLGDGTSCLGDHDVPPNGVDDACEGLESKLKWFQKPDLSPGGMDVSDFQHDLFPPYLLAADFPCTETGPITEIHVFGSWYLDKLPGGDPKNVSFTLSIHTDVPDVPGGPGYSMPGEVICLQQDVPFEVRMYGYDLEEGWLEPPDYWTPYPHGDAVCWEYIFHPTWDCLQEGTPDNPMVYWLDVQAISQDPDAFFGWKTSKPPEWNDDAVWAHAVDDWGMQINWQELTYPPNHPYYGIFRSVDLAFAIYGAPPALTGACCFEDGTCVSGITAADCAANNGTYGGDGTQCAGTDNNGNKVDDFCDGYVTLGACCYDNPTGGPDLCINTTQTLCGSYFAGTWYAGQDCATFTCPAHQGACCLDNGQCVVMTEALCQLGNGTYGGDGTQCAGTDLNGNQVDDFCDGIVTLGACCHGDPFNPSCINTTQTVCTAAGGFAGTWYAGQDCATFVCPQMGACCYGDPVNPSCANTVQNICTQQLNGTWYAGQDCTNPAFQCPTTPTGACCYGDDPNNPACINVTQTVCTSQYSGTWYGGQDCASFECPTNPEERKWGQLPDLTPAGLDIMATNNLVLADDFRCDEPGRITKVVVYGSWYHDAIPDPSTVGFVLSFHKDIPAVEQDFSHPGTLLCLQNFPPGSYQFEPVVDPGMIEEGWYDPRNPFYEFPGDRNVFKYTFVITNPCWVQKGRNGEPKVYWLNVQAKVPIAIEAYFGWKTSLNHWNDDATWATGVDPDISPWQELRYPEQHQMFPQSIDLAFEIYGVAEDCCVGRVGDANGMGDYPEEVTLGDIMLMVDVKFITGDCSKLPCLTEADVNQDGGTNPSCAEHITLGDIMRLVDFLFITGPQLGHLNDCL